MGRGTHKLALALLGLLGTACPIYDDQDCAQNRSLCAKGFSCELRSGACVATRAAPPRVRLCEAPTDCAAFETCDPDGACRPGSCAIHGCIEGYDCRIVAGAHRCVVFPKDAATLDASAPGDADAGGDSPNRR